MLVLLLWVTVFLCPSVPTLLELAAVLHLGFIRLNRPVCHLVTNVSTWNEAVQDNCPSCTQAFAKANSSFVMKTLFSLTVYVYY